MTGMQPDTVQKHLSDLAEDGLLAKVERRRRRDGSLGTWVLRLAITTRTPVRVGDDPYPDADPIPTRTLIRVDHPDAGQAHEPSLENPKKNQGPPTPSEPIGLPLAALPDPQIPFSAFWTCYPRRTGKDAARRKWDRLSRADRVAILAAVPAHVAHWRREGTEPRFIPHPATWLSQGRWKDDLSTASSPTMPNHPDPTIPPGYRRNREGRVVPL
jgi:hypothetical protein